MMSVLSSILLRLNAFIDSEIEQILCYETTVEIDMFCTEKSVIFLMMPKEDNDNYQDTLFGGFAPNSKTAKVMSENLGYKTVLSGSVSKERNKP